MFPDVQLFFLKTRIMFLLLVASFGAITSLASERNAVDRSSALTRDLQPAPVKARVLTSERTRAMCLFCPLGLCSEYDFFCTILLYDRIVAYPLWCGDFSVPSVGA